MARIVKDADERRKELLDTALSLFAREGYERTSIDRIVDEVGIAKGTFYHYFDSKSDLLGQLVADWADALYTALEARVGEMPGDALTRLRGVFANSTNLKLADRDMTKTVTQTLYTDENLRLRHALMAAWIPRTESLLVPIIADGMAEGTFHVADARATATVLTSLLFGWADRQADIIARLAEDPEALGRLKDDVGAVEAGMERILGIPEGSLGLNATEQLERFSTEE